VDKLNFIEKNLISIIGVMLGLFLSLLEAMIQYADTAPIEDDIGFEILSWDKFIFKTIIYVLIGLTTGLIIQFSIKKIAFSFRK
jgi:hypothetical protein